MPFLLSSLTLSFKWGKMKAETWLLFGVPLEKEGLLSWQTLSRMVQKDLHSILFYIDKIECVCPWNYKDWKPVLIEVRHGAQLEEVSITCWIFIFMYNPIVNHQVKIVFVCMNQHFILAELYDTSDALVLNQSSMNLRIYWFYVIINGINSHPYYPGSVELGNQLLLHWWTILVYINCNETPYIIWSHMVRLAASDEIFRSNLVAHWLNLNLSHLCKIFIEEEGLGACKNKYRLIIQNVWADEATFFPNKHCLVITLFPLRWHLIYV